MLFGFHAVNRGSNPLGDAKEIQGLTRNRKSFFRMWGIPAPHSVGSTSKTGAKDFGVAFLRCFSPAYPGSTSEKGIILYREDPVI